MSPSCSFTVIIFLIHKDFYMSKKISKQASSLRTISLVIGSLSLLVIALVQLTDKEVCTSNAHMIENQIRLSKLF